MYDSNCSNELNLLKKGYLFQSEEILIGLPPSDGNNIYIKVHINS